MENISYDLTPNDFQTGHKLNIQLKKIQDNFTEMEGLASTSSASTSLAQTILIKSPNNSEDTAENGDWKLYVDESNNFITAKYKDDAWEIVDTNVL